MKASLTTLALGLLVAQLGFSNPSLAAPSRSARPASRHASAKQKKVTKGKAAGDLKTELSFDDSVLHGEYQTPDEALAKVENEKGFGDLVGVRKHFKDRLGQASEQE